MRPPDKVPADPSLAPLSRRGPEAGRTGPPPAATQAGNMQLLVIEGPVWARKDSGVPWEEMLPAKSATAIRVAFAAASLGMPAAALAGETGFALPPPVELGRWTHGLPLFLAERVHLQTTAAAATLVPWTSHSGFALARRPWTSAALAAMMTPEQSLRPAYVVLLHLVPSGGPSWQAQFRLERVRDPQAVVIAWEHSFDPGDLPAAVDAMSRRVLRELQRGDAEILSPPVPESLLPPPLDGLAVHLSRLAEALAVSGAPLFS